MMRAEDYRPRRPRGQALDTRKPRPYKRLMLTRRQRRTAVIVGVTAIVLLAGWTAAWFFVRGEIERQTLAWIAQQRAQGTTVEHGAIEVAGWPLWWRITIEQPLLAPRQGMQGEWRGTRVQAWLRPWAYLDIPLRLEGDQRITFPQGGIMMTVTTTAAEPDARVRIGGDGRLREVELDSRDFVVDAPAPIGRYRGARAHVLLRLHPPPPAHTEPLLDATISLIDVDLPQPPVPGLATRVQRGDLDVSVRGNLGPFPLAQAIARWRDDGGTIEVNRLVLVSAPIDFDGNGTLALDAQNRVQLAFAGRLRGYAETIDALQRAGTLRPTEAIAARLTFTALQHQGADGRLEVRAQADTVDGQLFVNRIPLPIRMIPLRF